MVIKLAYGYLQLHGGLSTQSTYQIPGHQGIRGTPVVVNTVEIMKQLNYRQLALFEINSNVRKGRLSGGKRC